MLKQVLKIYIGSYNVDSAFCASPNCVCLFSWLIYRNTIMIYKWESAMRRCFRNVPCPCQMEIDVWYMESCKSTLGWQIGLESDSPNNSMYILFVFNITQHQYIVWIKWHNLEIFWLIYCLSWRERWNNLPREIYKC